MYIVVKNGDSIIPRGINRYGWKHLDDAEEFAASQLKEAGDVVEVCTLNPVSKLFMDIHIESSKDEGNSEPEGEQPKEDETPKEDEELPTDPDEGAGLDPDESEEQEPEEGGEDETDPSDEDESNTDSANE